MKQKTTDLTIESLGVPKIPSPIEMSSVAGDNWANYVSDSQKALYNIFQEDGEKEPSLKDRGLMELAGPRKHIFYNPAHVHAAIATCGGICPGLNNVIRSIVRCLWFRYGVKRITGIRYGYQGLLPENKFPTLDLNPTVVDDIQMKGGTILGSARGGGKRVEEIVDALVSMNINMFFCIGGDGTLRGASDIADEIKKRGLKISVVGIPKTIDNDLSFIQKSFGFDTAVSLAVDAVRGAHVEAKDAINGIGLVKVMGRAAGFIAAYTALSMSDVNFCLIPENPFDLEGENGFLEHVKKRMLRREHAVILVAEGAGKNLTQDTGETDPSGNPKLPDIGVFLKSKIKEYFDKEGIETNIKYIDPSYIIRSAPANPNDSAYCSRLGTNAVHAAMAGKTKLLVSKLNDSFVHIPIAAAVAKKNIVDVEGTLWRDVLENTTQPASMKKK